MISTQILLYTINNTPCGSNVVLRRFIRKTLLHFLTSARVILTFTFSVKIETAAIVFNIVCLDLLHKRHFSETNISSSK